jgi:CubicO group peptidase (beta-lactamase class C family)
MSNRKARGRSGENHGEKAMNILRTARRRNCRAAAAAMLLCAGLAGCAQTPDVVCDTQGCISVSKFQAAIAAALKNNTVGYVVYVGTSPPALGGYARTSTDANPPLAMLPDLPMNIASTSKTLTTIGVLQSLAAHNRTVDDKISPYLYPDWSQGPNINTITFRDLLTHKAGFRNDCDGSKTTYAILKQQIAKGVQLADKAKATYNNCNFAIFRELLPFMEGQGPTDMDETVRAGKSASFYIAYMNQHVFTPVGVANADCKPPTSFSSAFAPVLSYPFPAGSTNGTDWGDWTLSCGGGGWVITASNLNNVLLDLANGNKLLTNAQKSLMNKGQLGWDNSVRSDCPGPYPCKNGDLASKVWTYVGLFKCTVQVTVFVNSAIKGLGPGDIIGLVGAAYGAAAVPVPSGAPQPMCPA